SRCPAEIVHYNVAVLCRRLYAKYLVPKAEHLKRRVKEIEEKEFDEELDRYEKIDIDKLKELYEAREIESV
ncbi:MAG: hypothetical protein V3V59_00345, partial [Thermodesulfovibrionales bacterium]